jgi:hypothetical protein
MSSGPAAWALLKSKRQRITGDRAKNEDFKFALRIIQLLSCRSGWYYHNQGFLHSLGSGRERLTKAPAALK